MSTTVRVESQLAERLRQIAKEEQRSIGQVISEAIDDYQKQKLWARVQEDFARLRANPAAWKDYQDELSVFDGSSLDGLENEPPYYTPEEAEIIRAAHS